MSKVNENRLGSKTTKLGWIPADYYRNLVKLDKKSEVYPDKMESHEGFMEGIKAKHFRKYSFWKRV